MIHLLGKLRREHHSTGLSTFQTITRSSFRVFAALSVAVATLAPVTTAPAGAAIVCPAGAVTWAAGGSGNWSNPANWSTGAVPTGTDDVCIEDGTFTITVDIAAAANQLVSAGTVAIDPLGRLTLNAASDINILNADGPLAGAGPVTLSGLGSTWTSGTISTSLEIPVGASLEIATNGTKNLTGTLTNRGTVTQSGSRLNVGDVVNHGTWNITYRFRQTIRTAGATSSFTNYGTIERSGSDPLILFDVIRGVAFANHGTISVKSGDVQISGFETIGDGAVMHADNGAVFLMSAVTGTPGATVSGRSTITSTGTGVVEWRSNQLTIGPGAVVDAQSGFVLNGGTVAGTGRLEVSGPAAWERGTISGTLMVTQSGVLTIKSFAGSDLQVLGSLTNNGTVQQPLDEVYTSFGGVNGTITNNALWQFTNTDSKNFMIRGNGLFLNTGTVEGSATAASTGFHSSQEVRNTGTIASRNGVFRILNAPTHYASPILTGGTWEARNGSTLRLPATFTENNANLVLTGAGSSFGFATGSDVFTLNSGSFELAEGADYATGGNFTNTGSLIVGNAANTGDVSTLTVNGDLILDATGNLEIGIGGTPASRHYGTILISGAATLAGGLEADRLNDYIPVPGDSYQIMVYPSKTGTFDPIDVDPFYSASILDTATYLNGLDPFPIADAGLAEYNVDEGSTIDLDGSGSFDPGNQAITHEWQTDTWFVDNTDESPTFDETADDGDFTVTLEVCDPALQCDSDSTTVHVLNVNPTVTASSPTLDVNEGTSTGSTELATITDPGADTHTWTINWGDDTVEAGGGGLSISGTHTYAASDSYTITVTVTDDDGGVGSTTIAATVANVSPTVAPGTPELVEGDATTSVVIATFTDPGAETFSATMDWGDASGIDTTVDTTGMQVTGSHGYVDNGSYPGRVCVTDDGAPVCPAVTVIVTNARPTMDITEDTASGLVGDTITINGTYSDPGVKDTHTADIDWKDGSTEIGVPVFSNAFQFSHIYATDGTFSVDVCITDNDGGRRCDSVEIDIDLIPNLAPEVNAGGPYETTEGTPVDITGTASDPNDDPFTTEWTSPSGGTFGDASSLATTFTANDNGTYTITLTGTDAPFGAQASSDAEVTVTNVAPSIDSLNVDTDVPEGSSVSLAATFSDPGTDDTHTATIDWGDPTGTPVAATVVGSDVSGSHTYTQDGDYTVNLCVTDNDAGETCTSADITILNVLPTVSAIPDQELNEGDTLGPNAVASFTDPGSDTWTATINWGEGPTSPAPIELSSKTVSGQHTYNTAGTYTATVCVTDDDGTDCDTFEVDVAGVATKPPEGIAPIADAGGPYRGHEGRWIKVDGSESSDEDGKIVSYHWSSEDGGRFNNPDRARPKFKAPDNGTYTLTLEVTDNDGLTDRTTTTVTVLNVAPRVRSGRSTTIMKGEMYRLYATFSDQGADTHRTIIDWGDGNKTTVDPSTSPVKKDHKYERTGKYKVKVTVIDDDGGQHTDSHNVTVKNAKTDRRQKFIDFIKDFLEKLRRHWGDKGRWGRWAR